MLLFAANRFVLGASSLAKLMNLPTLFIGITIIAIGNSMPELCITLISGIKEVPDLAVGTLFGSNIAHIGLVLGSAAIIKPFKINRNLTKTDVFILFITTTIASILLIDNQITKIKGVILLFTFFIAFTWIIKKELTKLKNQQQLNDLYIELPSIKVNRNFTSIVSAILWLIFGVIALHISSYFVVESSQKIATFLKFTNLDIGALLLGFATNLPEFAIMVASIYNNERDLALGGVLGANIFGITCALGICGLFFPISLPEFFRFKELTGLMIITTTFCYFLLKRNRLISRLQGIVLVSIYLIYISSTFFHQ